MKMSKEALQEGVHVLRYAAAGRDDKYHPESAMAACQIIKAPIDSIKSMLQQIVDRDIAEDERDTVMNEFVEAIKDNVREQLNQDWFMWENMKSYLDMRVIINGKNRA